MKIGKKKRPDEGTTVPPVPAGHEITRQELDEKHIHDSKRLVAQSRTMLRATKKALSQAKRGR